MIDGFTASLIRGEKVCLMGRNGQGKTTLLRTLLANAPEMPRLEGAIDSGTVKWGHEAQIGYFRAGSHGSDREGHDRGRLAASV